MRPPRIREDATQFQQRRHQVGNALKNFWRLHSRASRPYRRKEPVHPYGWNPGILAAPVHGRSVVRLCARPFEIPKSRCPQMSTFPKICFWAVLIVFQWNDELMRFAVNSLEKVGLPALSNRVNSKAY